MSEVPRSNVDSEGFDPYHEWLGIPPEEQPADHYRLLGIRRGETKPNVIEHAANRQMTHLRTFQSGKHSAESQKLLNEIATAKVTLLNEEKKREYDASLGGDNSARRNRGARRPPPKRAKMPKTSEVLPQSDQDTAVAGQTLSESADFAVITQRANEDRKNGHSKKESTPWYKNPYVVVSGGIAAVGSSIAMVVGLSGDPKPKIKKPNPAQATKTDPDQLVHANPKPEVKPDPIVSKPEVKPDPIVSKPEVKPDPVVPQEPKGPTPQEIAQAWEALQKNIAGKTHEQAIQFLEEVAASEQETPANRAAADEHIFELKMRAVLVMKMPIGKVSDGRPEKRLAAMNRIMEALEEMIARNKFNEPIDNTTLSEALKGKMGDYLKPTNKDISKEDKKKAKELLAEMAGLKKAFDQWQNYEKAGNNGNATLWKGIYNFLDGDWDKAWENLASQSVSKDLNGKGASALDLKKKPTDIQGLIDLANEWKKARENKGYVDYFAEKDGNVWVDQCNECGLDLAIRAAKLVKSQSLTPTVREGYKSALEGLGLGDIEKLAGMEAGTAGTEKVTHQTDEPEKDGVMKLNPKSRVPFPKGKWVDVTEALNEQLIGLKGDIKMVSASDLPGAAEKGIKGKILSASSESNDIVVALPIIVDGGGFSIRYTYVETGGKQEIGVILPFGYNRVVGLDHFGWGKTGLTQVNGANLANPKNPTVKKLTASEGSTVTHIVTPLGNNNYEYTKLVDDEEIVSWKGSANELSISDTSYRAEPKIFIFAYKMSFKISDIQFKSDVGKAQFIRNGK